MENRVFDVFFKQFEENLPQFDHNHVKTFHYTNEKFLEQNDFIMYNSYESFKNAKSRYFKRRRHK